MQPSGLRNDATHHVVRAARPKRARAGTAVEAAVHIGDLADAEGLSADRTSSWSRNADFSAGHFGDGSWSASSPRRGPARMAIHAACPPGLAARARRAFFQQASVAAEGEGGLGSLARWCAQAKKVLEESAGCSPVAGEVAGCVPHARRGSGPDGLADHGVDAGGVGLTGNAVGGDLLTGAEWDRLLRGRPARSGAPALAGSAPVGDGTSSLARTGMPAMAVCAEGWQRDDRFGRPWSRRRAALPSYLAAPRRWSEGPSACGVDRPAASRNRCRGWMSREVCRRLHDRLRPSRRSAPPLASLLSLSPPAEACRSAGEGRVST